MDGTNSSIEVLAEIAPAVNERIEVFFDSGIRRGMDLPRRYVWDLERSLLAAQSSGDYVLMVNKVYLVC